MKMYYMQGLHCDGCVRWATELMSGVAGITKVKMSLVTSKVYIEMDRDVSIEEISLSLEKTKYRLTTEAPSFVSVFKRWFEKYLALIVAFSVMILWTVIRQILTGWSIHDATHDFMGSFFLILGLLKVFNWKKFAESFQGYDPLAQNFPLYAYIYPAVEVFLGVAYQFRLGEELPWNIITVLIMGISIIGIVKVLKRGETVQCACLGGYFNIPITWFTVFENGLMVAMAVYMQIFLGSI